MAYCQNCGSAVDGNFCAKCGSAVGVGSSRPGGSVVSGGGLADNMAGALCYIPLIGALIFLLVPPYNRNKSIRFHAFQALFILAIIVVLEILIGEIFWSWMLLRLVRL